MLINEVYETEDAIPKDFAENYEKQEDGSFRLKLIAGLKSALTKERGNAKTAANALATAEGKVEERIAAAVKVREDELKSASGQTESDALKKARDETSKAKRDASATHALQKAGGNISLMQDKVTAQLDTDAEGNLFVADEDGTPLLNGEGTAMTVDGLVADMKANPEFAGAFKGTGSAGGGGAPENGSGSAPAIVGGDRVSPGRRSQMTPREKVNFIRENSDEAYQNLPW